MRALRILGASAPVVLIAFACSPAGKSSDGGTPTPTPGPSATPTPTSNPGDHITADTTWTGAVSITAPTTIDAGVTVTVASNATISVASGAPIYVQGTLLVNGLPTAPVTFDSDAPGTDTWGGLKVQAGGLATVHDAVVKDAFLGVEIDAGAQLSKFYDLSLEGIPQPLNVHDSVKFCRLAEIDGSGDSELAAGTITFADSRFDGGNTGDVTDMSGNADVNLSYSHMGSNWHCLLHGYGSGTLTVTKTVLENMHWAFMISNITANISDSQILQSTVASDYGIESGTSAANAENNYWGGTCAPTNNIGNFDVSNCVTSASDSRVVDAGPRADGAGCEADSSF